MVSSVTKGPSSSIRAAAGDSFILEFFAYNPPQDPFTFLIILLMVIIG